MKYISLLSAICISILTSAWAANPISFKETQDITDVETKVSEIVEVNQHNKSATSLDKLLLVVFDLDNTLLTTTSDLGGDLWYQWQTTKNRDTDEVKRSNDKYQLSSDCLYDTDIPFLTFLAITKSVDLRIPAFIAELQNQGIPTFILTSRNPGTREATERELKRNHIDMSRTALAPNTQPNPTYSIQWKVNSSKNKPEFRPISYANGIMMTTGHHKGQMLDLIQNMTGHYYENVIFVDDTRKNVEAVIDTYKAREDVKLYIFYYTKVIEDRKKINRGEVFTKLQEEKMADDWINLNAHLNTLFPGRDSNNCFKAN